MSSSFPIHVSHGKLKILCDIVIHAQTPKGEYGPVEDIHMIMDHLMSNYLIGFFLKEKEPKQ